MRKNKLFLLAGAIGFLIGGVFNAFQWSGARIMFVIGIIGVIIAAYLSFKRNLKS